MNLDGFKVYRANFLPGFSRPLVLIAWCQLNLQGFSVIQVQYILVQPAGPVQVEGVSIEQRYLSPNLDLPSIIETLASMALDRAEDALEKLANQGVTLAEISWDKFHAVAHREGFAEKWQEVATCTGCSPLRNKLYEMEQSQLVRHAEFKVMTTRWH